MSKLTKRIVDAAHPKSKHYMIWDDSLTGFGLRVAPSGRKTFLVKYRAGRGENAIQRKLSIGVYGRVTVDEARSEAKRILGEVATGKDPAGDRAKAANGAISFDRFCDTYLEQHADAKKKASSAAEDRRLIDTKLRKRFRRQPVGEITRAEVARFHAALKGTPYTANRCLALLSKMFALAEDWGFRDRGTNPCHSVSKYREEKRERYLSPDELKRLHAAIDVVGQGGASRTGAEVLRLLILTGARKGEILSLRWDEFDPERLTIMKRDSKTGRKPIPISEAAADIIARQEQAADSPYVFPASRGSGHFQGLTKVWLDVRNRAKLNDVRIHDLRHTFASYAVAGGASLPVLGRILGHTQSQTTQRYAHLSDDPVRRTIEATNAVLSKTFTGAKDGKTD